MNDRQKLDLRQSTIRSRLAELGTAEGTEDGKAEIDTLAVEYGSNEARIRAFMVAGDEPVETTTTNKEGKERAELYASASVGDLVYALVNGRSGVDGAMRELQAEHGLASNEIHIRQLAPESYAVTPAPTNTGETMDTIIPYVFPTSISTFLGIYQPTVPVGDVVFNVLKKALDVRTPAENASAAETTGTWESESLPPARLQASYIFSRESRARVMGLDSALRENLSMGLMDGLDAAVISGTNGLLTGSVLGNHNVTDTTSYALYRSQLAYDRVDGRYASGTEDIRLVMGAEGYGHAASVYRGNNDNMDALMALKRETGGVRVSAHMPDESSNKQNQLVRLGMNRDYVAPVWENVALIDDEITLLKTTGQVQITALMLYATKLLRSDAWYKQQTNHA